MHDQPLMRVLDGGANGSKKRQPGLKRKTVAFAVTIDGLAFDQFQHDVREALCRSATIDQMGDVRMIETGEDLPLGGEAFEDDRRAIAATHKLDGDLLLLLPVVAHRLVHFAHATTADGFDDSIGADGFADPAKIVGRKIWHVSDLTERFRLVWARQRSCSTSNPASPAGLLEVEGPFIDSASAA